MRSAVIQLLNVVERVLHRFGVLLVRPLKRYGEPTVLPAHEQAWDYARYCTLELAAAEIRNAHIAGAVAEVGVYQGNFAEKLNRVFPDRDLYLFDTFEGFDKADVDVERTEGFSTGDQDFSGTSVEGVLARLKHREKAIVKQGRFPDTAIDVDDQFVFVSLDADLYQPILEGLRFFWPRLARGGFIFVHDYNNAEYEGARRAVQEFCKAEGIGFVPISDAFGTASLAK
jgi:O-methyltransferase